LHSKIVESIKVRGTGAGPYGGNDQLYASTYTGDVDKLYGGRRQDWPNAFDGDNADILRGSRGIYDVCVGDPGDTFYGCEGKSTDPFVGI
jgi:hypothetical protein